MTRRPGLAFHLPRLLRWWMMRRFKRAVLPYCAREDGPIDTVVTGKVTIVHHVGGVPTVTIRWDVE
jgi:hypothetical protein